MLRSCMMAWQMARARRGLNPRACAVCRRPVWVPEASQAAAVDAGLLPRWQARWLLGAPALPPPPRRTARWRLLAAAGGSALLAALVVLATDAVRQCGRDDGCGGWLSDLFCLEFDPPPDVVDVAGLLG